MPDISSWAKNESYIFQWYPASENHLYSTYYNALYPSLTEIEDTIQMTFYFNPQKSAHVQWMLLQTIVTPTKVYV